MCVLYVPHRVVHSSGLCQIDVEIQVRRCISHYEEIPGRIPRHVFQQFFHGYELSGTLRHLHRLSVLHEGHELQEDDLKGSFGISERRYSRLHSALISVMIRTQDVYQLLKASLKFVFMVCKVRSHISVGSVVLYRHPVLIVAKRG